MLVTLLGWTLLLFLLAVVLFNLVLNVPERLYPPLTDQQLDRQGVTNGKERIDLIREQNKLQNEARTTLLQGLAGGALLLGGYFTWRQVQVSRRQASVAEYGQITERYSRAIDQLGNKEKAADVAVGGVYALERLALDFPRDRNPIGDVLTTYVRGHAPWPPQRKDQPAADTPISEIAELRVRAPDVQAALTVLARGMFASGLTRGPIRLEGTDLRRADLSVANFPRAQLDGSNFQGANCRSANLATANLRNADFRGANLQDAILDGANLHGADLRGANLQGVHVTDQTRWPDGWTH
jgi:hypothetical protein